MMTIANFKLIAGSEHEILVKGHWQYLYTDEVVELGLEAYGRRDSLPRARVSHHCRQDVPYGLYGTSGNPKR